MIQLAQPTPPDPPLPGGVVGPLPDSEDAELVLLLDALGERTAWALRQSAVLICAALSVAGAAVILWGKLDAGAMSRARTVELVIVLAFLIAPPATLAAMAADRRLARRRVRQLTEILTPPQASPEGAEQPASNQGSSPRTRAANAFAPHARVSHPPQPNRRQATPTPVRSTPQLAPRAQTE